MEIVLLGKNNFRRAAAGISSFYRAMGFTVSRYPIRSRVEDEPYDIQMECAL